MAKLNFITATLQSELNANEDFYNIFSNVIVHEISRIETDDYCLFIDIEGSEIGSFIKIHDGGATYNETTDEMEYKYYSKISCKIPFHDAVELYFSIDEGILCYLYER